MQTYEGDQDCEDDTDADCDDEEGWMA